jgi:hypothetical protein
MNVNARTHDVRPGLLKPSHSPSKLDGVATSLARFSSERCEIVML